ncbi:GbsR/MarR family transcriptional regulator [Pseudoroseicyclus aestuarii]|uniref:DNA-binding transcriptional regulator GbsR (MarR family) n=1 Tax=Pseudoroseicyclus aestuarii TaxID=1795041 RepID=A0A318T5D5_9RHOB|nr:MarR family transcriptional regulator [Pseudoroseicyclus aestuarii]PYE85594.1 DNA-binding transcriptional regulator GbsR (MarR family) [Pseudoroseicyclus aestuarii]
MKHETDRAMLRSTFIERLGALTADKGLPRSAGRLFAMMVFDGETVSFSTLSDRLQISRASVSASTRHLEDKGLLRRVSRPGDRQDYFELAPDAFVKLLRQSQQHLRDIETEITGTLNRLSPQDDATRGRLAEYADFYAALDEGLGFAAQQLEPKADAE